MHTHGKRIEVTDGGNNMEKLHSLMGTGTFLLLSCIFSLAGMLLFNFSATFSTILSFAITSAVFYAVDKYAELHDDYKNPPYY